MKLGDYDGVEVTKYTYEITDDMLQDEIQGELEDASEEESTNAPSEDGNTIYMNLTASVDGEEAADPEETFITLGQEEYGAEFDEKLTGVILPSHTGMIPGRRTGRGKQWISQWR